MSCEQVASGEVASDENSNSKLNLNQEKRILLPSFHSMMRYVNEQANKRLEKNFNCTVIGQTRLPFSLTAYEEVRNRRYPNKFVYCDYCFFIFFKILDYLRICLWYSANGVCTPGDAKYLPKLRQYINFNYEESENNELHQYLQFVQRGVQARRSMYKENMSNIRLTIHY